MDAMKRHAGLGVLVHPKARVQVHDLLVKCQSSYQECGFIVDLFETWRSPERQRDLYHPGAAHVMPANRVTQADAWESPHQYGLAWDFACRRISENPEDHGTWYWPSEDQPWDWLRASAVRCGLLVPIKWDRGHVEHPLWRKVREVLK